MKIIIKEIRNSDKKSEICQTILNSLPKWFGIPESNADYIKGVRNKPFYAAVIEDDYRGFICLEEHNQHTSEIYIIGVLPEYRNMGVGTKMLHYVITILQKNNKDYLTVKTIPDSHPSKEYAESRQFYLARGFLPLEVFPELWGKGNPCLFMVKTLLT